MNNLNFQALFEASPGLYLVLLPDFTIVAVSDAYLEATMTKREDVLGKGLFVVFPDNPNDPTADGVSNLRFSLNTVLATKQPHKMADQKYDIRRPDGSFEIRFWSPVNKPILDDKNNVIYIIHSVVDVTKHQVAEKKIKSTELLLQSSIESLKDMIILSIDRDYRYLNFNSTHKKATFEAYGVEVEWGMSLLDHISNADERSKIKRNFDRAFDGEWHTTVEEFGDKERYFFETRYSPIINENNEIIGATAFAINISDRKMAENTLLETNYFLDTILENIPNMLFVKDAESLRFLRLNAAGEKLLGYSKSELIGKNDYDFFSKEQADFFVNKDKEVLKKGDILDIPEELITTTLGERWLHTKKIPVNGSNGKPMYLLGISEDITDKKKAEDEILMVNERLAEANRELEAFSYSVSHDLKAPLRTLQGFSKALLDNYSGKFDSDANRWLEFIGSNANRMGNLIDDILNFSKVSRADIKVGKVNMNVLVNEIFSSERNQYVNKDIQLIKNELPSANADISMLRLVWQNFISNAIKYSSKNETICIQINGKIEGGYVEYSIKDNGAGFDEKYKDKLFGVFQRLHSNSEFEGTGVGLAIVNRIIQKHNGWIKATSQLDVGSEFSFAIPI